MAGDLMALRPINGERRSAAVRQETADARTERQAVRALATDLQTIIDGITAATTLADLRGHVKDLTRTTRRLLRLVT